jgi:hypothetical protein
MMQSWDEIRQIYPNRWVLIEAIHAETVNYIREIQSMTVINTFDDFQGAWMAYLAYHRAQPKREFYVLHTKREQLNIEVIRSIGIFLVGARRYAPYAPN